ncbi:helix-turn-helix domain-containing protein [Faecalimonas umbilicata]|nr:helix-turn-helix domain-containing protein [Faecalimonas umbilicata]
MDFEEILFRAKMDDEEAKEQIVEMYRPLLIKNALVNGIFDEDLYQELILETMKCIRGFKKLE